MKKNLTKVSATFSVRQLAKIFCKSEDTIRRWKNDGIGVGSDNIKLIPVQDNTRHLAFSAEAVRDFVKANPYLLDKSTGLDCIMDMESDNSAEHLDVPCGNTTDTQLLTTAAAASSGSDDSVSRHLRWLRKQEEELREMLQQLQEEEKMLKQEYAEIQRKIERLEGEC